MKKSTKGALAAGAAAVLLLGGAGSLAYWNDTATADAGTITAGSMDLSAVTCGASWLEGATPVTTIVPGDTVTKSCTGTLTLVGDHIGATVTLDAASVADAEAAFNDEVDITASMTAPAAAITAPGTYDVTVDITVVFDGPGATNDSQLSTATLDDLQLEAVQTHDAA
ncbi:alternate-type signal peptide domain-containing protein [Aeromicrobium choanae]|uniref:Alternate signal-mediated exported protein, RER_14450 family n=1 Tax=Aeromicrobium choanae TaxID=1736691 RepID=A0A1T4Z7C8_9ACTN|nr:alternate-type signal peptide domain-containing protein [Aeromicrobium choanae]SKB09922.1 alternate signal-mediated exported protein, RER_14450 family [Aeromicrobium choanae]